MNTKDSALAYVAGFFDGEGCIHAHIRKRDGKTTKSWLTVSISQKDPYILNYIQELTGLGGLYQYQGGIKKLKYWRYSITGTESVHQFLDTIFPYLLGKKEQARISLELAKRIIDQPNRRNLGTDEVEIGERTKMVEKIIKLKREMIK